MNNIVVFVVVLVVSMIDSSQAVTCYQCNYTRSSSSLESWCGGMPFDPDTKMKCSGPICSWQLSYYTSPKSHYAVQYDCLNAYGITPSDSCAQYRANYTVFKYDDSCCYKTRPVADDGTSYDMTICFCQKEDCNGKIKETEGSLASTPQPPGSASKSPLPPGSSDGMPLLKPPIWAMTVVTITAMAAIIG